MSVKLSFSLLEGTWKEQLKQKFRNGRRGTKRTTSEMSPENVPPTDTTLAQNTNKKKAHITRLHIVHILEKIFKVVHVMEKIVAFGEKETRASIRKLCSQYAKEDFQK